VGRCFNPRRRKCKYADHRQRAATADQSRHQRSMFLILETRAAFFPNHLPLMRRKAVGRTPATGAPANRLRGLLAKDS